MNTSAAIGLLQVFNNTLNMESLFAMLFLIGYLVILLCTSNKLAFILSFLGILSQVALLVLFSYSINDGINQLFILVNNFSVNEQLNLTNVNKYLSLAQYAYYTHYSILLGFIGYKGYTVFKRGLNK